MPNELKNALNATPDFSQHKKLSHAGGSTVTMMLWTPSVRLSSESSSRDEGIVGVIAVDLATLTTAHIDGYTLRVSDNRFEIDGGQLRIKADSVFDADDADRDGVSVNIIGAKDGTDYTFATYTLTINDINDEAPQFTSGNGARFADGISLLPDDILYTAAATPDVAGDTITWSLKSGDDAALFDINTAGEVTFKANTTLDQSVKDEYHFTVIAQVGEVSEEKAVQLDVGINIAVPTYELSGGTSGDNTLTGSDGAELIKGLAGDDTITSGGGVDVISGGAGDDTINLGAGAQTVLYRFESDAGFLGRWDGYDDADTIHNFELGTDRLVLIDVSGDGDPINNFEKFAADSGKPEVFFTPNGTEDKFSSITFDFNGVALIINFTDSTQLDPTPIGIAPYTSVTNFNNFEAIFGDLIEFVTPDDLPASLDVL